ncbi:MAG: site-2 protease family protein [Candidatus Micrarchaeota archaeon]|nr:site-2 protease family protein [Candidatus Micrarchaeota archaeon]
MDGSPQIMKINGISIQIHWTLLLLFLFALALVPSSGLLPFVLIVLLFVCVLLHELAHSITSQMHGIQVKRIVLIPLGGMSMIDLDKVAPGVEIRIALAGPFTSIILGMLFGLLVPFTPSALQDVVVFLFEINLLLGIFNLLPAFPLDGGRALRAYLEKGRTYLRATEITVRASVIIIVLFVLGTIVYEIYANADPSYKGFVILWDFIIALFLYGGAQAELQNAYLKEYGSRISMQSTMSRNFAMMEGAPTITQLYMAVVKHRTHLVLYRSGGKLMVANVPRRQMQSGRQGATSVTGYEVPTVEYGQKLSKAVDTMENSNIGLVAVTRRGRVVGVITADHMLSVIALYASHSTGRGKSSVGAPSERR